MPRLTFYRIPVSLFAIAKEAKRNFHLSLSRAAIVEWKRSIYDRLRKAKGSAKRNADECRWARNGDVGKCYPRSKIGCFSLFKRYSTPFKGKTQTYKCNCPFGLACVHRDHCETSELSAWLTFLPPRKTCYTVCPFRCLAHVIPITERVFYSGNSGNNTGCDEN